MDSQSKRSSKFLNRLNEQRMDYQAQSVANMHIRSNPQRSSVTRHMQTLNVQSDAAFRASTQILGNQANVDTRFRQKFNETASHRSSKMMTIQTPMTRGKSQGATRNRMRIVQSDQQGFAVAPQGNRSITSGLRMAIPPEQQLSARSKVKTNHWQKKANRNEFRKTSQNLKEVLSENKFETGDTLLVHQPEQMQTMDSRPFKFLSSLGSKQAPVTAQSLAKESALGLKPKLIVPTKDNKDIQKGSKMKIFTQLDVSKAITRPSDVNFPTALQQFVLEDIQPSSKRVRPEFKINTNLARQKSKSAVGSSRLSRRSNKTSRADLFQKLSNRNENRGGSQNSRLDADVPSMRSSLNEMQEAQEQSFGQSQIPQTELTRQPDDKLPYPELFDRTARTFAATIAKFGDLSYFTPVQRIGAYVDYSQRLQKRHLTDLIAYLKTSKPQAKPVDEEFEKSQAGYEEFLENCTFHGHMLLEDAEETDDDEATKQRELEEALIRVFEFSTGLLQETHTFKYNAVWSAQLLKQVELSSHRFKKYIESNEAIKNEEITKFRKSWMQRALDQVPEVLLKKFAQEARSVFQEVFEGYGRAMRQAILEYILRSPDERKRLHILVLPRARATAALTYAKAGGYSVTKYAGHHQRKREAEGKIKLGLISYSITSASLLDWWQEFRHFKLLELRNLGQFVVEREPGRPGGALYAMEMDEFFGFQETYQRKVRQLLRDVWLRGCMLIVKRFKWLRTPGQQQARKEASGGGRAAAGKWTFKGYKPAKTEESARRWVKEEVLTQVHEFDYSEHMTPLQQYYFRVASVHANVHLGYFLNEEGLESTDVLGSRDTLSEHGIQDLPDTRDCAAYRSFVQLVGADLDMRANGYKQLSKEQRSELKFAAGHLMQSQLRETVDRSVRTLRNFFVGFLTLDQLRSAAGNKPLRMIRPLITPERAPAPQPEKKQTRAEKQEEAERWSNPVYRKQQAAKKKSNAKRAQVQDCEEGPAPTLTIPDFMDYQDYVSPVFRLEVVLLKERADFGQGASLRFSKSDEEILAGFATLCDRTVSSFDDFQRPEFAKVHEVAARGKGGDVQKEASKDSEDKQGKTADEILAMRPSSFGQLVASASCGVQQDFDQLLFPGHEAPDGVYSAFLHRAKVTESDRAIKGFRREFTKGASLLMHPGGPGRPPTYVDRYFRVADRQEECFLKAKEDILHVVSAHLRDTKRVLEIFEQFEPLLAGTLAQKVGHTLSLVREEGLAGRAADKEYAKIIKEVRFFEKLSRQLPTIVFLPMFEVGLESVKVEIQSELAALLRAIFEHYEADVGAAARGLCQKYSTICDRLGVAVTTPAEVVQMEKYKVGLLAEMGRVKAQASAIRESVFFLLRADHELQPETQELVLKLHTWPDRLDAHVQLCDEKHDGERQALEADVAKLRADFERDTQTLEASLREVGQWGDPQACWQNIEKLTQYQRELTVQEERMTCLLEQEKMIHGTAGKLVGFQELRAWFAPYADLWTAVHSVMSKRRFWLDCSLPEVDPTEVDATIRNCNRTIKRLQQALPAGGPPARALSALSHDVADLADQMPLIEVLCSPALRPRHWADVQGAIASAVSQEDLTLAQVKLLQLHRSLPELTEIGERARREARLEQMLSTMEGDWTKQSLELTALRNTDIRILAGASVEAMQQRLDEHYLVAQTVRSSPDVAPLQERAEAWEQQLAHLQDVLEVWLRVQANFLYLEPVLQAEDIRTTLPAEAEQFQEVLAAWQDLTARAKPDLPVLELVSQPDLLGVLKSADDKLEAILKSLHTYLETKRESFPRFFFLSNEELLEILGESRKPERVQPHLKKCFEGIDRLVFEARAGGAVITGLLSKEGEHVAVLQAVAPHEFQGAVEKWLLELETQMEAAVRDLIFRCIVDYAQARSEASRREQWLHEWQGQAILVSSQHSWTERVEQALQSANANRSLTACFAESRRNLAQIVALVREALPDLTRQTLGSLIVLDVHARDVLEELIDRQTSGVQDFQWISRLRTYLDSATKQLSVRMVTTVVEYGHEYLGAASRLVITPLTDRCYRTLMTALELNLGGAPEGPAGTGKTETTKDLAKAVAVHCLVFNCAEGLDALAMAKFFKGLASAGSWSCFDEFNRIDVEVLSVVAQQILEIQTAKGRGLARFLFEESWLTLKPRCNIFITMNPGYAGRAELPDNLKALFRPVAMMIPDYAMIGEITLYSYGFLESKGLAEKIVATFRLCSEQLSAQNHYDYGMRAVKAVLSAARQLKQRLPGEAEAALILQSITQVNLPKFVSLDIPLFEGIVADLFPGCTPAAAGHAALEASVRAEARARHLEDTDPFVEKVLQLYEMVHCRHGLMLVGPPLAAKTTTYQVLAAAICRLAEAGGEDAEVPVETHILNPKSLALPELYGSFDAVSHEFSDGVLGRIFRSCASGSRAAGRQWIALDGPVDAEWVENMNTVLDDNKKLCLLNGEVIQMNDGMRLIFETDGLSQASPATVSRCGMVYMEPAMLGAKSHLASWQARLEPRLLGPDGEAVDPSIVQRPSDLFESLFSQCADFVLNSCTLLVPCSEVQLARGLMGILEAQLLAPDFSALLRDPHSRPSDILPRVDMYFLYALVWSVGAITDEAGRQAFSVHLRKVTQGVQRLPEGRTVKFERGSLIPDGGQNVDEYFVDRARWASWKDKLRSALPARDLGDGSAGPSSLAIVPTSESLKIARLLELCVGNRLPVLLVGPTGTGKSVSVQQFLRATPRSKRSCISITFSAKSTTRQTGEILLAQLEKRGRRVLGPAAGKRCAVFVDDLSMPSLEQYGAQPPIELLRQLVDHRAWYDQSEKGRPLKEVVDLDFIAAMGPAGGARNPVTPRLLRHFNVLAINHFTEAVLTRIFGTLVEGHLRSAGLVGSPAARTLRAAADASVAVLLFAQRELRPTPSKSHYLFNLRDLARVVEGLRRLGRDELGADSKKAVRLWVHEVARVFSDRLTTEDDQRALYGCLVQAARERLREDLTNALCPSFGEGAEGWGVMARQVLFTDLRPGRAVFDEVQPAERGAVQAHLGQLLEGYNATSKRQLTIVLFDYAVMHLLRICRVLKMPCGHAFLIGLGGTGRQSLGRLAAHLCDHEEVALETPRGYGEDQWRDDLRALLLKAGQEGKSCALLLPEAQLKGGFMLDDINNLLNSGSVPNLFPVEERLQIQERLRALAKRAGRQDLHDSGTVEEFEEYFTERVREHLHVVLAMSPVGSALRDRIRNFPSLVNCCTIDWFLRWPDEALEAVCEVVLEDAGLVEGQGHQVATACRVLHQSAEQLSARLGRQRRPLYVTPTSYLELLLTYKQLLGTEREKTLRLRASYERGVQKLLFTAEEVEKMREELNEKQPRLEQMTVETDLLMQQIEQESSQVVAPKQAQVQVEEAIANQQAREAEAIKADCDSDLAKALPLLAKAQDALNTIKSSHIGEIKVLGNPPGPVKRVLHAVCVMCQRKAERTPKKENPKLTEDNWWYTAQKFMAEKNFLQGLLDFDKDSIPEAVMRKIRDQFLPDPDFKPARVEKASVAAKGLCQWIRALDQYDQVVKLVAPKRARAKEAEAKYSETLEGLATKQAELRGIIEQFEALQARLEGTKQHKQRLQDDILDCEQKLTRAKALLEGLGGEQQRWQEASVALDAQYNALAGDCLVGAATIAYLAPLTSELRGSYSRSWRTAVEARGLCTSPDYSFRRLLGEAVTIRQWGIAGLPTDAFSVDNAIMVARARRWPLMIDPQGQASRWVKNMEGSLKAIGESQLQRGRLSLAKATDPAMGRRLEQCISLGLPLLLEGLSEEVDPLLEPLLDMQTTKTAGGLTIRLGDADLDYSPDFQLYMTTKLFNPHFLPEVSTRVTLINFAITFDGLRDQLLDIVVRRENAALDEERQRLIQTSYANKRAQRDVEQRILDVLRTSQGNILDDEKAIDALAQSQALAREIEQKQAAANATQAQLDEAREGYEPVAHHCSLLFFLVSKLVRADVMYQYSLTWFLQLFARSLSGFRAQARDAPEQDPDASVQLQVGIEELADHFTYSLYANVCRSLFEKDKLLFSFLLAAKLGQAKQALTAGEYELLVQPQESLDESRCLLTNECVDWLPNAQWSTLGRMASSSPAIDAVVQEFAAQSQAWRVVAESDSPMREAFPTVDLGAGPSALSPFLKLCVVKAIAPGKFVTAVREFVLQELGERYLSPPLFDIECSYNDSSSTAPLIFVLPGSDPLQALTAFAKRKKKLDGLKTISLGQGQGARAEAAIAQARKDGGWVLLQNCHLHPSWMPRLEQICDQLASGDAIAESNEESPVTHPGFRLWLSSYRSEAFPALVLRNGVKMTNEPPRGFAANMRRSCLALRPQLATLTEQAIEPEAAHRLFFGLCMFHAVVEGRRDFGALGWNVRYEFSVSDLQITTRQLCFYAKTSQTVSGAVAAVARLAGDCNYGGRLADERDRRALLALLEDYCTEDVSREGYCAQGLAGFTAPAGARDVQAHVQHIQSMPQDEPPELFGLHANASVARTLRETHSICGQLFRMGEVEGLEAGQEAGGQEGAGLASSASSTDGEPVGDTDKGAAACRELLARLPSRSFDLAEARLKYPVLRDTSMNSVLVQELQRFNALLELITSSAQGLLLTLNGEQLASEASEQLHASILLGEVPTCWLKASYPTQRTLAGFVADLRRRLALMRTWVDLGPPPVFWLPGLFSPQAFLTAVLQDHARRHALEIDRVCFGFDYREASAADAQDPCSSVWRDTFTAPSGGALVSGLSLEGAGWSASLKALEESAAGCLHSRLPLIHLKPKVREGTDDVDESVYRCPMYRTAARRGTLSTTGHSTNFVMYVDLPAGRHTAKHWTKRGAAILNDLAL